MGDVSIVVYIANRGEIARRITRTCDSARHRRCRRRAADYLDPAAQVAAARRRRRRRGPPRLRLPVGERRLRPRGDGRGDHLGRPDARGHRADGPQGRRPRDRRRGGGSGRARRATTSRLPDPRQGRRRRRWQGHADRPLRRRARRRDRRGEAGVGDGVRRRHRADRRSTSNAAGTSRSRCSATPTARDPPADPRVLGAAPAPEGDRGGARARPVRRRPGADPRRRRRSRAQASATPTPAPSSSCSTPRPATSTSSR